MTNATIDPIDIVYKMLQNREVHPSGTFDGARRFYAKNSELINVREPSRRWPNSHMSACRTKKYVRRVSDKFDCTTVKQLLQHI